MGPAFPLFIAMGGLVALVVALGRRGAGAAPAPAPTPVRPSLPPPSPLCTPANLAFIVNVLSAAQSGKATLEMLNKAIELAQRCDKPAQESALVAEKKKILAKAAKERAKAERTGRPPKATKVTKETGDFVCGVLPGKGFACRPKNVAWKNKARAFQNALNIATTKTPGPRETAKLVSVDGRIGPKTALLFQKIKGFVNKLKLIPNSLATPERISDNIDDLTKILREYINSRGGSPSIPSESEIRSAISGAMVSPLPGVDPNQWVEFMRCMIGRGPAKGIGPFKLSPKRLRALGITRMPSDRQGQIEIFGLCMRECAKQIMGSPLRDFVGQEVTADSGVRITMSGLLALCKCAGPKGALSWLTNPEERERFPNTSEAFIACNGIF